MKRDHSIIPLFLSLPASKEYRHHLVQNKLTDLGFSKVYIGILSYVILSYHIL